MVERVARAIFKARSQPSQVDHEPACGCGSCLANRVMARAAIVEMREPTEAMAEAQVSAMSSIRGFAFGVGYYDLEDAAKDGWRDMIDAALAT